MKRANHRHCNKIVRHRAAFPNAASAAYRYNKLVDYLLTAAATLGMVTAVLFLVTL